VFSKLARGATLGGLLLLLGIAPASSQALSPVGSAGPTAALGDSLERANEMNSQPPVGAADQAVLTAPDAPPASIPAAADAPPAPIPAAAVYPPEPMFVSLPGGTLVTPERFYSRSLGKTTWYEVILPPGYQSGKQRYPVLYMLHGAAGGAGEWLEIGLHTAADALWQEQASGGFIIVLPEGGTFSYYLNHASNGPRYGDYLAFDIVQEIDTHYRTIPAAPFRAIGGLSMGGDGALRLGLTYPSIFGVVGAHSPTTRLSYDQRPGDIYGDEQYWQQNNPLWLIRNTDTASSLQIWIDMGLDDVWLPNAQALLAALEDSGSEPEYHELEGDHGGEYWTAHQASYLRFYAQAFDQALAAAETETALAAVAESAPAR
jgi:enterochelin esterase-like enzyme